MKKIMMSNGMSMLVDDSDLDKVSQYKWSCEKHGNSFRVCRKKCKTLYKGSIRMKVYLHRFIMEPSDGMVIDHIDGNPLNNQRSNLRICTQAENMRNSSRRMGSISKFLGVTWCKTQKKWRAQIELEGKNKAIGRYEDEKEAALAYNVSASFAFGEFARLNQVAA